MRYAIHLLCAVLLVATGALAAQEDPQKKPAKITFDQAAASLVEDLERRTAEFTALQEQIAAERSPLTKQLGALELELARVRKISLEKTRAVDQSELTLSNLKSEIKKLESDTDFVSNLLGEYVREFESSVHMAELQRYKTELDAAKLAVENTSLAKEDVYAAQIGLVAAAIERLHEALGGVEFEGQAVDSSRLVRKGKFVMVGHAALFRSAEGDEVGTAGARMNSFEPAVDAFHDPGDARAAEIFLASGQGEGELPLDPTDGNALALAQAEVSLVDEFEKGGTVMYPILGMAAAALLLAFYKWLRLAFLRRPSRRRLAGLLAAVREGDAGAAMARAQAMPEPTRTMLVAGVENMDEPRELMEEAMYETVLTSRIGLNSLLPFIAICAASAPLLGLLGTVTGIINTFKLITIHGSGDVKMLSGGISEALITTKYGLIVAIPSLLLHAYLWRKARGVIGGMETAAVAFTNEVASAGIASRRRAGASAAPAIVERQPDPGLVREQVRAILGEMLGPMARQDEGGFAATNDAKPYL